jgi:hypothetical protein
MNDKTCKMLRKQVNYILGGKFKETIYDIQEKKKLITITKDDGTKEKVFVARHKVVLGECQRKMYQHFKNALRKNNRNNRLRGVRDAA